VTGTVSVVVPIWNREETVSEAVRSALGQTAPPMEVLVCDDGSTDGTRETVLRLAGEDPRVRWIPGIRSGRPAVPRNRGVRQSAGEWIAFLDSDDWWDPDKLSKQLDLARETGLKAVSSNALKVLERRKTADRLLKWDSERIRFKDLLRSNPIVCSSALLHRSLFETVVGFPEPEQLAAIEDYALWLRVATQTDFAFLDEPLVGYRDVPEDGIRGRFPADFRRQQSLILRDFLTWSKRRPVSIAFRLEAWTLFNQHRLKQARKNIKGKFRLSRPAAKTEGAP
jgi:glycosyltransferase involved in cell wall biosynthesis